MVKFLDGKKRVLMVLVFGIAAAAGIATGQDYRSQIEFLFSLLGWNQADAAVNATVVSTFVVGAWAVIDGIRKSLLMDKAKKGIIPPEDVVFPTPNPKV